MHQYFRFEQIEVARNQNSGSRLQLYPPSPLVRIHLNCQLQEKKKEKRKGKKFNIYQNPEICADVSLLSGFQIFLSEILLLCPTLYPSHFFGFFLSSKIVEHYIMIFMKILAQFALDKWYTFAAYPRLRKFIWQATSNMSGFWKDSQFLWIWGWINRISWGGGEGTTSILQKVSFHKLFSHLQGICYSEMVKHKIVQTRQELNKGEFVVNYLAKFQIRSQSQSCLIFKTSSKIQPLF